jgi:hypothetical protein
VVVVPGVAEQVLAVGGGGGSGGGGSSGSSSGGGSDGGGRGGGSGGGGPLGRGASFFRFSTSRMHEPRTRCKLRNHLLRSADEFWSLAI